MESGGDPAHAECEEVDMCGFQANLLIEVSFIILHPPLSDIKGGPGAGSRTRERSRHPGVEDLGPL